MYVCLCKALTESEVVSRTRACISDGIRCPEQLMQALDLECEDTCGYCVQNPQHIVAIFDDELELHLGYSAPSESSVTHA